VAVWAKVYDVEVVWVNGVFAGTVVLLTGQRYAVKPVLLLRCYSEEAQSTGYIYGIFSLYP